MIAAEAEGPVLVDFSAGAEAWRPINDGVMGGLSRSRLRTTPEGTAVFEGEVSLENNGGFASVRAALGRMDLSEYAGLAARVRGDGRAYQIRLRTNDRFDGIAYRARVTPAAGAWQVVKVPFSAFEPTFRGRRPAGAPPLAKGRICQLGFLVGDKQAGPFRLEIAWVRAHGRVEQNP
jgi:monofunctional biosynthetic peptidoglycan transglycosylase